jgi:uncharacterized protein (TIGR02271 family)
MAARPPRSPARELAVLRAAREEVVVGKRAVGVGRVRVNKKVRNREELIEQPLEHDKVEIDRVPINRLLRGPVKPRYEGDVLVIPVVEEVAVVTKQLMLKEELHIRKRAVRSIHKERVALRSEEVNVERVAARTPRRT